MASPIDTIPQTTQDFVLYKELLYKLIVDNKYQKVLETGTDVGDTTRIFSTALHATQGQLVTIDLVPPKEDWPTTWPIKNIQFVTGDSKQLTLQQPIDLLFLDAHKEGMDLAAHVGSELAQLGSWVRAGGKIVLDDAFHSSFGVPIRQAVEAWCRQHQLVWTTYPQHNGMIVIEISHGLR